MKIRDLLLTFVGLVISIAVPAFAQEQNTIDPEARRSLKLYLRSFKRRITTSTRLLSQRYGLKMPLKCGRGSREGGCILVVKPSKKSAKGRRRLHLKSSSVAVTARLKIVCRRRPAGII